MLNLELNPGSPVNRFKTQLWLDANEHDVATVSCMKARKQISKCVPATGDLNPGPLHQWLLALPLDQLGLYAE